MVRAKPFLNFSLKFTTYLLFCLLLADCTVPPTPGVSSLSVTISSLQDSYQAIEPLMMKFTLKNVSKETLTVLKWNTPLDGFYSDMFIVEVNGRPVRYLGKLAFREPPSEADFVQLKPNQELSVEFDLAKQYAIYDPVDYTIRYQADLLGGTTQSPLDLALAAQNQPLQKQTIASNTIKFVLSEERKQPPQRMVIPRYQNCEEEDKNTIFSIIPAAEEISFGAYTALETLSVNERSYAERYLTWFRDYSVDNYQTAIDRLKSISNAIGGIELAFECDPSECGPNDVAYVYSNDPYLVYLCDPFWHYPLHGQGSQAGILIHEISHFDTTADTDDNAYCWAERNCTDLDVDDALENADSYRRFCENAPPLQPIGPYQKSIFCQEDERCCDFNAAGNCTRCEASSIECTTITTCAGFTSKFVDCAATIGGRPVVGHREVRCVNGRRINGPCYPYIQ